jgi:hypothetical protein
MKRLWMILACLLLFCAGTQAGTIVYDSTGQGSEDTDSVQSFGPLYDSFSTGTASGALSGLQLLLSGGGGGGGGDFMAADISFGPYTSVGLYADNSTAPGALIATLGDIGDSSISGPNSLIDLSLVANPVLSAGTRYWIGLVGFGTSTTWNYTYDTSGIGVEGEYFANPNGVFDNDPEGGYQMQVSVGGGAVPEPSTFALTAGAFAALALFVRRRARK